MAIFRSSTARMSGELPYPEWMLIYSGTDALRGLFHWSWWRSALNDVLIIRAKFLSAANRFVDAVFNPEPLNNDRSGDDIHSALTSLQKKMESGFNKAYTEKARLAVPSAIAQDEERYLNRLCGRL